MKNKNIVIIDYGVGNTYSVSNAINYLGYKNIKISNDEKIIKKASILILPGVGAFEECINNIKKLNLDSILHEQVIARQKPILGICVGMQLFATTSQEKGIHDGLNWIPGIVKKIVVPKPLTVPHVGWNDVTFKEENDLFLRNEQGSNFYFDHSYYLECSENNVIGFCKYGIKLTAAVQKENIFGVQFHPEKSHINGLKLFRSFFNKI